MHRPKSRHWHWLLLLPYFAIIWVPSYNLAEPALFGIPFFYWYQLLGIPLSAVVIYVVYRATYRPDADAGAGEADKTHSERRQAS